MGEGASGTTTGDLIRDYHGDPFPHSLLRTRELFSGQVPAHGCESLNLDFILCKPE